ncbi:YqcI/YcgG family protein [Streptomyces sviceus]|uniref:YqcI/YcgG family protein n=1 Tax=Streptomyces sviceus TaxID=285530 RepID=UPI00331DE905
MDTGVWRLTELVEEFTHRVLDPAFPCMFAARPVLEDTLLFGLAETGTAREAADLLAEAAGVISKEPEQIVVIFADLPAIGSLVAEREFSAEVLRSLRRLDRHDWPEATPLDPEDPRWVFWFEGVDFFFNFSTPGHRARRSRSLGPAWTAVVQSRSSFDTFAGVDHRARVRIRARLAEYDAVPPHTALGSYGDPSNREAHQYFLGDGVGPGQPLVDVEDLRPAERDAQPGRPAGNSTHDVAPAVSTPAPVEREGGSDARD